MKLEFNKMIDTIKYIIFYGNTVSDEQKSYFLFKKMDKLKEEYNTNISRSGDEWFLQELEKLLEEYFAFDKYGLIRGIVKEKFTKEEYEHLMMRFRQRYL